MSEEYEVKSGDPRVIELAEALNQFLKTSAHTGLSHSSIKSHGGPAEELCPVKAKEKFDMYSEAERVQLYLLFLAGKIDFENFPQLAEVAYKCQNCGACGRRLSDETARESTSTRETRPATSAAGQLALERTTELIREFAVDKGCQIPEHALMIEGLKKERNVFGKPKAQRGAWATGLGLKDITKETADVFFYAGCRFSYDKDLWPAVRGAATILKRAGVDVGIADDEEACCGGRAYETGYLWEFNTQAEQMIRNVIASSARILVTPCSECYYALKRLYPLENWRLDLDVLHIVEYISRLIDEGSISFTKKVPMRVTYHDPCHLGRKLAPHPLYDEPRNILKALPGVKLVEMKRIKERSWCCGAGSGVLEAFPDFSNWSASERIEEAMATGAEAIVTACPWCERNFKDTIEQMGADIAVYDVLDLVCKAMGIARE